MDCLDATHVEARDIQPHVKPAFSWKIVVFNTVVHREDEEGRWSWFEVNSHSYRDMARLPE